MGEEFFKDIKGYEGLYQISNYGNVKSLNYKRSKKEGILKPNISKRGYKYVILSKKRKQFTNKIHRLVSSAFIDNKYNKPLVNHINGIKTDNRVENLEWCTYSENINHAFKTKLRTDVSEKHWNNKLSKEDVLNIKKLLLVNTQTEISKIYNVNQSTISDIKLKKIRNYE